MADDLSRPRLNNPEAISLIQAYTNALSKKLGFKLSPNQALMQYVVGTMPGAIAELSGEATVTTNTQNQAMVDENPFDTVDERLPSTNDILRGMSLEEWE